MEHAGEDGGGDDIIVRKVHAESFTSKAFVKVVANDRDARPSPSS